MVNKDSKLFGYFSSNQTQIVYSTCLLSIALLILSNLQKSTFLENEDEEEDLLNSRNLIQLLIFLTRLLAQTALFSSLLSLIGTITSRSILQIPLKLQAIINLFITSFSSVVLGTLYLSPTLLNSASHQLCLIAIETDSISNLNRNTMDDSIFSFNLSNLNQILNSFWNINVSSESCDERASSFIFPSLIFIFFCNLIHFHLVYVLFSPSIPSSSSSQSLLPLFHSPSSLKSKPFIHSFTSQQENNEKPLILIENI